MRKTTLVATLTAVAGLCLATQTDAAVLASDDFSYSDGGLLAVSGGVWGSHSGIGTLPVQVADGKVSLLQGPNSREDVSILLSEPISAGVTLYAGFDVSVTAGSEDAYFAHFRGTNGALVGRVYVSAPKSGGDFTFGVSANASTVDATSSSDTTFGETYRVVLSYNYDTGVSEVYVAPDDGVSTPTLVATSTTSWAAMPVHQFALRQSLGNSTQVVDNLVVATSLAEASAIPEPTTAGLLGLAGLGLLARRRRA